MRHPRDISRQWTDQPDTIWHRRGERGEHLDPKRTRTLRGEDLPLAIWSSGEVTWYEHRDEKQDASEALHAGLGPRGDIQASEWKSGAGNHMLMLENHCYLHRAADVRLVFQTLVPTRGDAPNRCRFHNDQWALQDSNL